MRMALSVPTVAGDIPRLRAMARMPCHPRWTGQIRPFVDTAKPAISGVPRRELSFTSRRRVLARMCGPWCASCAAALEDVGVMQQPVEQRGDGGGVAEQLSPVVDGSIRGEHRGGPLVTAHDQLEQVLGRGVGQLAHAEVVDDEQGHAGQLGQIVLAGLGERRLGELLEEGVRFAVDDAIAPAGSRRGRWPGRCGSCRYRVARVGVRLRAGRRSVRWRVRRRARG